MGARAWLQERQGPRDRTLHPTSPVRAHRGNTEANHCLWRRHQGCHRAGQVGNNNTMSMEGTLKQRDGKLYVLYTYDEYTEPFRITTWWRVQETRGTGYGE